MRLLILVNLHVHVFATHYFTNCPVHFPRSNCSSSVLSAFVPVRMHPICMLLKGNFSENFLSVFIVNLQSNALKVCKEFFVKILKTMFV